MTNSLLQRLIEMCCRHEFTWPHAGVHGTAYQACLLCGAVYSYDCSTMRRTGRLVTPARSALPAADREPTGQRLDPQVRGCPVQAPLGRGFCFREDNSA